MSNDEALTDVILRSRDDLQTAIDISVENPRPSNVCKSHDALFGMVQANARATVTILTVLAKKDTSSAMFDPATDTGRVVPDGVSKFLILAKAVRPYAWPTAIICFSPNAVGIIRTVLDHFSK